MMKLSSQQNLIHYSKKWNKKNKSRQRIESLKVQKKASTITGIWLIKILKKICLKINWKTRKIKNLVDYMKLYPK
jgi:hypothetical protein